MVDTREGRRDGGDGADFGKGVNTQSVSRPLKDFPEFLHPEAFASHKSSRSISG